MLDLSAKKSATTATESVHLTHEELLFLDGKVRPEVQKTIDAIRLQYTLSDDPLIGRVLRQSLESGKFSYRIDHEMTSCGRCGRKREYWPFARTSRKGRKGAPNHDNPKTFTGISFNPGFIVFRGSCDLCSECNERDGVTKQIVATILDRDLPVELVGNKQTRWKFDMKRKCFKCKEEIWESEIGQVRTLMGDGYYPGKCPLCGFEGGLFCAHGIVHGVHRMVRVEELRK